MAEALRQRRMIPRQAFPTLVSLKKTRTLRPLWLTFHGPSSHPAVGERRVKRGTILESNQGSHCQDSGVVVLTNRP